MHQLRVTHQVGSETDQLTDQGKLQNLANRCELPYCRNRLDLLYRLVTTWWWKENEFYHVCGRDVAVVSCHHQFPLCKILVLSVVQCFLEALFGNL